MANTDSKTTRTQLLFKALEEARARPTSVQPANGSRALEAIRTDPKAQSAIKYPNKATALRRAVSEAQKAENPPTTFRIFVIPKKTTPETGTLQRKPLEIPIRPQPVLSPPRETASLSTHMPALPTDLRSIASISDVGDLVRRARKRRGMAQGDLAILAGTGRRFISELEAGKPTLEFDRMLKVCGVLGVEHFAKVRNDGG